MSEVQEARVVVRIIGIVSQDKTSEVEKCSRILEVIHENYTLTKKES